MSRTGAGLATKQVTCAQCGVVGLFGGEWRYPHIHIDHGYLDPRVGKVVCSDACEAKLNPPPGLARCTP